MIQTDYGDAALHLTLPTWLHDDLPDTLPDPHDRVRFVIDLARRSVENGGGPFGAAVFHLDGRLIAAGANLVLTAGSSLLHAEVVAILAAQARLQHHLLVFDTTRTEMVCSCDPCAMCLGAIHWAGTSRLLTAASGHDARDSGFDEGPVDDSSFAYLARNGIDIQRGILRDEAAAVLHDYKRRNGTIYGA